MSEFGPLFCPICKRPLTPFGAEGSCNDLEHVTEPVSEQEIDLQKLLEDDSP